MSNQIVWAVLFSLLFGIGVGILIGRMMCSSKKSISPSLTVTIGDITVRYEGTLEDVIYLREHTRTFAS